MAYETSSHRPAHTHTAHSLQTLTSSRRHGAIGRPARPRRPGTAAGKARQLRGCEDGWMAAALATARGRRPTHTHTRSLHRHPCIRPLLAAGQPPAGAATIYRPTRTTTDVSAVLSTSPPQGLFSSCRGSGCRRLAGGGMTMDSGPACRIAIALQFTAALETRVIVGCSLHTYRRRGRSEPEMAWVCVAEVHLHARTDEAHTLQDCGRQEDCGRCDCEMTHTWIARSMRCSYHPISRRSDSDVGDRWRRPGV